MGTSRGGVTGRATRVLLAALWVEDGAHVQSRGAGIVRSFISGPSSVFLLILSDVFLVGS